MYQKHFSGIFTFTGLEINKNKIPITFSKVCECNPELQSIIDFQVKKLPPIMYLGLLINGKMKS